MQASHPRRVVGTRHLAELLLARPRPKPRPWFPVTALPPDGPGLRSLSWQLFEQNLHGGGRGASSMPAILSDVLLFGWTAAFTTWLVIQLVSLLN